MPEPTRGVNAPSVLLGAIAQFLARIGGGNGSGNSSMLLKIVEHPVAAEEGVLDVSLRGRF